MQPIQQLKDERALEELKEQQEANINLVLLNKWWWKLRIIVGDCPIMGCDKKGLHEHQVCPKCGCIDHFNPRCDSCVSKQESDRIVSTFDAILKKEKQARRGIFSCIAVFLATLITGRAT